MTATTSGEQGRRSKPQQQRSRKALGEVVGKRKPGLFSVLVLGFVVVITASALTARENDSKSIELNQPWQQDLD